MKTGWRGIGLMAALALVGTAPDAGAADVSVDIRVPGVSIFIGDRDHEGRHWDGEHWRDDRWWRDNCHRFKDHKDFRGRCDPPPAAPGHCPPGQAKKGNC